jgi:hypothetical protein
MRLNRSLQATALLGLVGVTVWWATRVSSYPLPARSKEALALKGQVVAPAVGSLGGKVLPTVSAPSAPVPGTPTLRLPVDRTWSNSVSEAKFERFRAWTEAYRAAEPAAQAQLESAGVELARARREELGVLIRADPERALDLAVPVAVRLELPAAVVALLEERIDGWGDLAVLAATPLPGREPEGEALWRTVQLGERFFRAYVYGRRLDEPARFGLALHGLAVDGRMAVDANPVRVLEAAEAQAWLAGDPSCSVSGASAQELGTPLAVDTGTETPKVLCGTAHAESLNRTLIEEESDLGSMEVTPAGRLQRASAYTEGNKKLLLIRVDFSDNSGAPFTDVAGTNHVQGLDTFYRENSLGRAGWLPLGGGSAMTPTLRLAKSAATYGTLDPAVLRTDARTAATAAGFNLASYQFDLICFKSVPNYSWAGLGYVGAPGAWIQGAFDAAAGVSAHELGHNFGLSHANFWDTAGANMIGKVGTDVEYGDSFDTMGNASGGKRHFNVRNKVALNWLRSTEVVTFSTNGVYRIFAHDLTNAVTGARALKVARNSRTNYWFELRQKFTDNRWLLSGLGVRWARSDNSRQSLLLDTTAGSAEGKNDSALVLGRTFTDPEVGLHITPLRKNGTTPESMDVQFVRGKFTNDISPTVALTPSATAAGTGVTVRFTAAAADEDGDAVAYFWDFGDGTFGTNGATASKSWSAAGDYLVRCTVSDLRGGVGSDSLAIRVGSPTTYRLSGKVTRDGQPVGGVRIFTSNTRLTYTDSDGSYVLPGVTGGTYTLRAQADGLLFTRAGFTNPLVVSGHKTSLDFTGTLPGDLEAAILVPAGAEWRYHDGGVNLGTAWRTPAYDASAWKQGAAQLGYGDDDVSTILNYGPNSASKHPTYYFRHEFFVAEPARFLSATLGVIRDDGAMVFLNGKEVFRSNLPSGSVSYTTLASNTVGSGDESTFFETELAAADFVSGGNVLAVEIHQSAVDSSDVSFNLRLDALLAPAAGAGGDPALTFTTEAGLLRLAWPAAFTGFGLQMRRGLDPVGEWDPAPFLPTAVGGSNVVHLPLTETALFLRLAK